MESQGITAPSIHETGCLAKFIAGYVDAMIWTLINVNGEELDAAYTATAIHPESLERLRDECRSFYQSNCQFWSQHHDELAGHCHWASRNNPEAGFRNHVPQFGVFAYPLAESSAICGKRTPYVGNDGMIHIPQE